MSITIDPEVFNTAKAFDSLKIEALNSAKTMEDFVQKLVGATHMRDEGSRAYFQHVDFNDASLADGVYGYGLYLQNVIDDRGNVDNTALIDMSFDVHKDQHHLMRAACLIRSDSTLEADPDTGQFTLKRPGMGAKLVPSDQMDSFANDLFTWVFKHMPEADRPQFLENCEKLGLINQKPSIGFGAELRDKASLSVEQPSVH
ncbi:MAG: hypothetical protein ACLFR0_00380 [Alphaproteobacteria bacterium]